MLAGNFTTQKKKERKEENEKSSQPKRVSLPQNAYCFVIMRQT